MKILKENDIQNNKMVEELKQLIKINQVEINTM